MNIYRLSIYTDRTMKPNTNQHAPEVSLNCETGAVKADWVNGEDKNEAPEIKTVSTDDQGLTN
jgi:hypothetical protein